MSLVLLDAAGRRRSPATCRAMGGGAPPRNKGQRYPADPPRVEEIIAVMRAAGDSPHGPRIRALMVILWRAGLRINEALVSRKPISSPARTILVRRGKGGKRREVGMDEWGWEQIEPWRQHRSSSRSGRSCASWRSHARAELVTTGARAELRRLAAAAGVRRRFAPHQLRHAHAVEMAREGVPLPVIQRQLGHAHLGVTSTYLQGIDTAEIINTVHGRRAPMIPASAGLRL